MMVDPKSENPALSLSCWREINLSAIAHNYRAIRSAVGRDVKIMACLKQDAYGCGAGQVAAVLDAEGVDGYGAVSLQDARHIRERSPEKPILLYPGISPNCGSIVDELGLTVTISSLAELEIWSYAVRKLSAFIKVDLGFWRAGALPAEVAGLLACATRLSNVQIRGLYAHLSELPGSGPHAIEQCSRLKQLLVAMEKAGNRPGTIMLSSSDGVLRHPEMDFDAIDPGALLFGLANMTHARRPLSLRPALDAIKARVVSVKRVDDSIGPVPDLPGYRRNMRIGVLAIGWGHGLPRSLALGACAIVNGRRAPILPPLHLEHLRIDLTEVPDASFGDEAVLLGFTGRDAIGLSELSANFNTDDVGVYCGLQPSLTRVYVS